MADVALTRRWRWRPNLRANEDETSSPGSLNLKARKDHLAHAQAT